MTGDSSEDVSDACERTGWLIQFTQNFYAFHEELLAATDANRRGEDLD